MDDPDIMRELTEAEIDQLIEPSNYTGSAQAMINQVLQKVK